MKSFLKVAGSILICFAAGACAFANWKEDYERFKKEPNKDKAVAEFKKSYSDDDDSRGMFERYENAKDAAEKNKAYRKIEETLGSFAAIEEISIDRTSEQKAKKIKSGAIYKIEKSATSANWLEKVWERLKNFKFDPPDSKPPQIPAWLGTVLRVLFYILIGVAICGLIYLAFLIPKSFSKRSRLQKRSGGLLEEGEELLSEDEYLVIADQHIANGDYRSAIRFLYLACLLRADQARIARFEPSETNWEHLRRIEASKAAPKSISFRDLTKQFDLGWYGFRSISFESVQNFRNSYVTLKNESEIKSA